MKNVRKLTRYTNGGVVDMTRTVIVDSKTLAPVRIQQRFGPELVNVYQIDFSGQTLTQILIGDAGRPARVSTVELEAPVVETGLQAVFVLSLPLETPGEVTVNTYLPGAQPQIVAKTYHLIGVETPEVMSKWLPVC